MNKNQFKARIEKAKKHIYRKQDKITAAIESRRRSQAKFHQNELMNSFDAKLLATVKANSKFKKKYRIYEPKMLMDIAGSLDVWARTSETARITLQAKERKPDEPRAVIDFGIRQKARQYLVKLALEPSAKRSIKPNQYSREGGTKNAIETTLQLLHEGYSNFVEIDIANCYSSYNEEVLADLLNLPVEISNNVVIGRHMLFRLRYIGFSLGNGDELLEADLFRDAIAEVQHGIPQGSALSPLVSDMLLSRIDLDLPDAARLVIYADNFLILAKDEGVAHAVADSLRKAISSHPAGPLTPRIEQSGNAEDGFDFLGYHLYPRGKAFAVRPSDHNWNKFDHRYQTELDKIPLPHNARPGHLKRIKKLENWVKGWCAAFSLWEGAKEFEIERFAHLKKLKIDINNELSSLDEIAWISLASDSSVSNDRV